MGGYRFPKDKEEFLLREAYNNLIVFGKLFLPGDFLKSETPAFHYVVAKGLLEKSTKPLAIIIPRGHGKTTLVRAKILHDICYCKKAKEWGLSDDDDPLFYGWVSSTQRKSMNNIKYIRLHAESNLIMRYYFGDLSGRDKRGFVWGREDLEFSNRCSLVSRSNLSSLRGENAADVSAGAIRYSGVFLDDTENEANTRTASARENLALTIMDGIFPSVDVHKGRVYFVGTPVHYASFCQKILDSYYKHKEEGTLDKFMWEVITFKATQPKAPGGVLWNSYIPRSVLDRIKLTYAQSPRGIAGYYQEYELEIQNAEFALWNRNHLRYWDGYFTIEDGVKYIVKDGEHILVNTFIGCDPATDIKSKASNYSVIMAIAIDKDNNGYVLEYVRKRYIPSLAIRNANGEIESGATWGVVDYIFDMAVRYDVNSVVVEDVAMNRTILNDYLYECKRRNTFKYGLIGVKPGGTNKVNRIYSVMNNRFASGSVYLKDGMYELENEILTLGDKMAYDDLVDALTYAFMKSYPPSNYVYNNNKVLVKKKPVAKNWMAA